MQDSSAPMHGDGQPERIEAPESPSQPKTEDRKPSALASFAKAVEKPAVSGGILIGATLLALLLANFPVEAVRNLYDTIAHAEIGIPHVVEMSVKHWASDAVLAIFFFVVGLELKREFETGALKDPATAALPIVAAVAGMVVPAVIYIGVIAVSGVDAMHGWAVPVATDIAFAVAVLTTLGPKLPAALRTFLLTLAVMDDLLAILIIALFYSQGLEPLWFIPMVAALGLFAVFVQSKKPSPTVLIVLGVLTWWCMWRSGVHATISAVLMGLLVPAEPKDGRQPRASKYEHVWSPISNAIALPIFAFFAAGVPIQIGGETETPGGTAVMLAVFLGLFIGKPVGIALSVMLFKRLPGFKLDDELGFREIAVVGMVAGIGFTVSLLIGDLAFREHPDLQIQAQLGVLSGSFAAAVAGAIGAALLNRRYAHPKRATAKRGA